MVSGVILPVAHQNESRPLFDAQRVQASLLLVLENRTAADGDLLYRGEADRGQTGQKDDQQDGD